MKYLFRLLFFIQFLIFINCKEVTKKKEITKLILKKIYSFDVVDSTRTKRLYYDLINYENDSIYYCYGIVNSEYAKSNISDYGRLYIKGRQYSVKISPKTKDSIAKLYHLRKFEFNWKKKHQYPFEYEDCALQRKIKMDSGSIVHTLQAKNGAVFQVIDSIKKTIRLQVCYKGKTYTEPIPTGLNSYNEKLDKENSGALFYDIDKDGEEELIIVFNNLYANIVYADVYKINLP